MSRKWYYSLEKNRKVCLSKKLITMNRIKHKPQKKMTSVEHVEFANELMKKEIEIDIITNY